MKAARVVWANQRGWPRRGPGSKGLGGRVAKRVKQNAVMEF